MSGEVEERVVVVVTVDDSVVTFQQLGIERVQACIR